jgi:hypothetical protein
MKVGVISAFMDYHRKGGKNRSVLQPLIGLYIAGLLPPDVDIVVTNETWQDPDWDREYDLLFISSLHPDFDRARQISHYWRRRGARTIIGGTMASTYPDLCRPFFDSVVIGDPEDTVPRIYQDFLQNKLEPLYVSSGYNASQVPVPRFDLVAGKHPVPLSLEVTRGCPFSCDFCALTGLGTRFHTRPPGMVVRDIKEGQRMLRGNVPSYQIRHVSLLDNNIGGHPHYLKELCEALTPLKVHWGSCITFNIVSQPEAVKMLSRSGCRFQFVGLESFNPKTLADMNKRQNAVEKTRAALDNCRRQGIVIVAGLVVSPEADDCLYLRSIPRHLQECGLHLPTFISFECPIPGTPYFERLAEEERAAFLPNALLRDFNGYTLTVRPKRESLEDFIEAYRWVLNHSFSIPNKISKFIDDQRFYLSGGWWTSAAVASVQFFSRLRRADPARTYIAGTDIEPPEATTVPLTDKDFNSEEERRAILEPWKVTDAEGRALPIWRKSMKVFGARGALTEEALRLINAP